MASAQRQVEVERIKDIVVVRLNAKVFDSTNFPEITRTLFRLVDKEACEKLVLNLGAVEYFFSESVGLLVSINKRLLGNNVVFRITNLRESAIEVLSVARLLDLFDIHDDEQSAMANL